jgi:hypothetical protein
MGHPAYLGKGLHEWAHLTLDSYECPTLDRNESPANFSWFQTHLRVFDSIGRQRDDSHTILFVDHGYGLKTPQGNDEGSLQKGKELKSREKSQRVDHWLFQEP